MSIPVTVPTHNFMPRDFDLKAYLRRSRERVENFLEGLLPPETSSRIAAAMRHSVLAGGKRIRPILCLAAAAAVDGQTEDAMPAACALELVHTYSLIHDDLPAMDDDILRRGRPTCHVAFDEATAILAGDALLTLAFQLLTSETGPTHTAAPTRLTVIHTIAAAAGYGGMIGGQMTDIASEGRRLTLEELEQMHRLKTGALIVAAVKAGTLLGGGTPEQIQRLVRYGQNLGLAFQITDDILNVEGDPALLGKAVGTDHKRMKTTYPALLGLDESKALARERISETLKALESFDSKADPLRAIAAYVIDRKR